jgi:hypothetical protein
MICLARELEQAYSTKQVALSVYSQKAQETVDKIFQVHNSSGASQTKLVEMVTTLVLLTYSYI